MLDPLARIWTFAYPPSRNSRKRPVSRRVEVEPLEDRCLLTLFPAVLPLKRLNGATGFSLSGVVTNGQAGNAVSPAGDVNGDGLGDFLISAPGPRKGATAVNAGKVYVVFGKSTGFPAKQNLVLDGTNGFVLRGIAAGDRAGLGVGAAGDVNGDNIDDLIVGAPYAGDTDRGQAYVVFGRTSGFAASLTLSGLNGTNGFMITGAADDDRAGLGVSGAGDVNGDNIDDLVIGAPGKTGSGSGHAYIVFGKSTAFTANLDLGTFSAADGVVLNGAFGDSAGAFVHGAGDVNGDGLDDVIVSAYAAGGGGSYRGVAYVVFGNSTGFPASMALAVLNGTTGFRVTGIDDNDFTGTPVSGAGDINGDGFDDLLVGAAAVGLFPIFPGEGFRSYVVFGHSGGFAANFNLSSLDGDNGFAIHRVPGRFGFKSGLSLSAAGDVNGDGLDDVLVGITTEGEALRGKAYVLFGKTSAFAADVDLSALNGANGFTMTGVANGDRTFNVAGIGDVNGDSLDDLLVGAPYASPGGTARGKSYVVFGRRDLPTVLATGPNKGQPPEVKVFDSFRSVSYTLTPYDPAFKGGVRVAVGDVNNDGTADIITAPGKGIETRIFVFDGVSHALLATLPTGILPYVSGYMQGAFVAAADIDGVAGAEIIVGPGQGASTNPVKAFKADGTEIMLDAAGMFPYGPSYTGGVRVAAGNVQGGAAAEIVTARSAGPSDVAVFDGSGMELHRFKAYAAAGGNFVAVADLDGDGVGEIITGPEGNQKPLVKIFEGATGTPQTQLAAFPATYRGGVRVAAQDVNGDGRMDILVGGGTGQAVRAFDRLTLKELDSFFADTSPHDGVFVAAG